MIRKLSQLYKQHPLAIILSVAFLVRLVSAIFAKGYGMHDDHFLIIENARSWASGEGDSRWNAVMQGQDVSPSGHSLFYPLLHMFLFKIILMFGIESLDTQMYIIRVLHALFSLLTVYWGYKLVYKTTVNAFASNATAWILALLWCMPWLSVRNLVEVVCIPLLLGSTWFYLKDDIVKTRNVIISALLMGIAFSIRFQVIFFIGGFGLALLIYKRWKDAMLWTIVLLCAFVLTQLPDLFIWHRPFAEMQEYIIYNFTHSGDYLSGSIFKYIGVILGVLVPPVSVLLLFGFLYGFKRLFLFLPAFCFLLFHSLFPNKQERFIFPILPSVIILGVIGLYDFYRKYPMQHYVMKKVLRICMYISIVLNVLLLVPVSVHYSKQSRVETMNYLSKYENVQNLLIENTNQYGTSMLPLTYLGKYPKVYSYTKENQYTFFETCTDIPDFILFEGSENLEIRIDCIRKQYPDIRYEATMTSNFIDKFLHKMNPKNIKNYDIIIYRNVNK